MNGNNLSELLRETYEKGAAVGNALAGLSNWASSVDRHIFTESDFASCGSVRAPEHPDEGYIKESPTVKETDVPVHSSSNSSLSTVPLEE
jgi:hypothetical protein